MGYKNAIGLKPTRQTVYNDGGKPRKINVTDLEVDGLRVSILHTNTSRHRGLGGLPSRATLHWTGGSYTTLHDDYHVGFVWDAAKKKMHVIKLLPFTVLGEHAYKANTRNVGMTFAAMAGATESNPGSHPIVPEFLAEGAIYAAEFCAWYKLDPETQLTDHHHVDQEIGRNSKWDIKPYWSDFHRLACEHHAKLKANQTQFTYLGAIKE